MKDALGNVTHTRYDSDNKVVAQWGVADQIDPVRCYQIKPARCEMDFRVVTVCLFPERSYGQARKMAFL